MTPTSRDTGINLIGAAPWGTHFCQFYNTREDLLEILVPYFKAGLENNEFCMWVTSEPLSVEEAHNAMALAVPGFDRYLADGQIEIIPYTDWYTKDGYFDSDRVLAGWVSKLDEALVLGFEGLRLTGNTFWLEAGDWREFNDYEALIDKVIGNYRMMAICTYSLAKCGASEIIDVVSTHQFALIKKGEGWDIIESAERRRTEELLEHTELQYRTLFDQSPDGVVIIDSESARPVDFNNVACLQLGYSREEFAQLSVFDFEAGESREETIAHMSKVRQGGWDNFETRQRTKTGEIRDVQVSARLLELDDQAVFYCIFRDVTEQKQAETALLRAVEESLQKTREAEAMAVSLQEERDRLDIVMENSPEANLVLLDRDFNFLMVNSTYAQSGRMQKEEFVGKNHFALYPHEENEAIFRQVRDTGVAVRNREKPFEFPDQPWRGVTYWDWTLTPVKDKAGRVQALVFSLVDVTDKVHSRQLNEALNDINAKVSSTLDFDAIMNDVMAAATEAMNADSSLLATREPEGGYFFRYVQGMSQDTPVGALLTPANAPVAAHLLETGEPMAVNDTLHDERFDPDTMKRLGIRSSITAPLVFREHLFGVIAFRYQIGMMEFSQPQADFVKKLATSISFAMENARLYRKEHEDRARMQSYATRLSLLHDIGLALNRETDKRKLLASILEGAAELTSAGVGAMILVNKGKTDLVSMYYAPWYEQRCTIVEDASLLHQRIDRLAGKAETDSFRVDFADLDRPLKLPAGHPSLEGLLIGSIRDTRGRTRGYFMLSHKAGATSFSDEDETIISLLAAQSSVALISAENFEREHIVAETLQDSLLPEVPVRDGLEVGLVYHSARSYSRLGGDFYDFIDLGDGRMAVVVGDVCGKGLEAASATAMVKYTLRAFIGSDTDPGRCLTELNRTIARNISMEKFVTLGLAVIDRGAGVISYSSAGHPEPLLCNNGGNTRRVPVKQSVPLGVLPDFKFMTTRIPIDENASILMYTDGLIEARPAEGEPFGIEGAIAAMAADPRMPAQNLAMHLKEAAVEYSAGHLRDDMALVLLKISR